jgi:hypothetical protein
MSDEQKPEPVVEDLDVPAEDGDAVKGGAADGTSNTLMVGEAAKPNPTLMNACATGKHLPEAKLTA